MQRAKELYRQAADRTPMGTLIDQATRIRDQELMELLVKTAGQPNATTGLAGRDRGTGVVSAREGCKSWRAVRLGGVGLTTPCMVPTAGWLRIDISLGIFQRQQQRLGPSRPPGETGSGSGGPGSGGF
jgi:hypothetical protein